jgi:predicted nucleic acid-binding protein
VDLLNDLPSPVADAVADVLGGDDDVCTCGIVVAEVFHGLHRHQGRDSIRRSFEEMIFLEPPGIRLYLRAAGLYRALRQGGTTVRSAADCIIAAIAEDGGCDLLARDHRRESANLTGR